MNDHKFSFRKNFRPSINDPAIANQEYNENKA